MGEEGAGRGRDGRGEARAPRSSSRRRARRTGRATSRRRRRSSASLLGPIPKSRAATNGVVIRNGYVVAEFGDTNAADPTYSVAKSMLATVAGVAVREGLIKNLDAPVGSQIKDGGYDSPQNAKVTWRHHLQQETRVGRRDVGQEARLRRHRRRSATASASRARCRRRARSTNTTTSASTASRCRCCACSRSRCPTCSATR